MMICASVGSYLRPNLFFSATPGFRKKNLHFKNLASITEATEDTENREPKFIEVGKISKTHGIRGEVIVCPDTGFGELRFSTPGKRWLRRNVFGKETIDEIDLVKGRAHVGKNTWIVTFEGYNTIELSQHLIGSTILVREEDRPVLENGEVYINDVIGMTVFLKENGSLVGTVIFVAHAGDSPLLRVRIDSLDVLSEKARAAIGEDEFHTWIPLVEQIVPVFDIEKREMYIDPPDGLLELNLPTQKNSKNDQKQKFFLKKKLKDAKKQLLLMGQGHILDLFSAGEKDEEINLANQIIRINVDLFNMVLQKVDMANNRWNLLKFLDNNSSKVGKVSLSIGEKVEYSIFKRQKIGLDLMNKAKVAIILVLNGITHSENEKEPGFSSHCLDLFNGEKFLKMERRKLVPLVLVCPTGKMELVCKVFSDNDYFGFERQQVWFLEEENLPIFSNNSSHSILMKLPWKVMESPLGSGGVITLLSSKTAILNTLEKAGIEYILVCDSSPRDNERAMSLLFGYLVERNADVGVEIGKEYDDFEWVDMVFRTGFFRTVVERVKDMSFCTTLESCTHFELVDNKWRDVVPSSPNSLEVSCSLENSLEFCRLDKIFVLQLER